MVEKGERHFFRLMFQVGDVLTVLGCWALAYWIRFSVKPPFLPEPASTVNLKTYLILGLALAFVWYLSMEFVGAYKRLLKPSFLREIWTVARGSLIGFLISVTGIHFLARDIISRGALVFFFALVLVGLVAQRSLIRSYIRSLRAKGWRRRKLLFVGAPELAETIAQKISRRSDLGVDIEGLVPVDTTGKTSSLKVLGSFENISDVIRDNGILEVIVCLKNEQSQILNSIIEKVSIENTYVRVVPDVAQFALLGFELEEFDGVPIVY